MSAATATAPELAAAIESGDTDAIHTTINAGADINARNDAGLTPLQYAVLKSTAEAVYVLLERGAEIEAKAANTDGGGAANTNGGTALHLAARKNNAAIVELLLNKGADPDSTDAKNRTPLHLAAEAGSPGICRQLIDDGAAVQPEDADGRTPRQLAAAQSGDTYTATALYLQTMERNRGLDRAFEQACRHKVTTDITALKSHHPERFKIQPAKKPTAEPVVPHHLTLKL